MKYFEIDFKLECNPETADDARALLADAAGEAGCESFEDTENGLKAFVQTENWNEDVMKKAIEHFIIPGVHITYIVRNADDKDWNQEWEAQGFEPIDIEGRLLICDAKKPVPATTGNTEHVFIDARLAFGTGTHETTRLIVSTLLHQNLKDKRVIDCGCGTGILGIVAAKHGAKRVIGYDIDEWSVENSRHNAALNGVENMEVYHGDANVLNHISGVFDVVMANINRNILLNDLETFKNVMAKGSLLILSGFYLVDIPLLLKHARQLGLEESGRKQEGDWACLILTL